jgi:hypothetical protein
MLGIFEFLFDDESELIHRRRRFFDLARRASWAGEVPIWVEADGRSVTNRAMGWLTNRAAK